MNLGNIKLLEIFNNSTLALSSDERSQISFVLLHMVKSVVNAFDFGWANFPVNDLIKALNSLTSFGKIAEEPMSS